MLQIGDLTLSLPSKWLICSEFNPFTDDRDVVMIYGQHNASTYIKGEVQIYWSDSARSWTHSMCNCRCNNRLQPHPFRTEKFPNYLFLLYFKVRIMFNKSWYPVKLFSLVKLWKLFGPFSPISASLKTYKNNHIFNLPVKTFRSENIPSETYNNRRSISS